MNSIWKILTDALTKDTKRKRPFTAAFYSSGICIGVAEGVKSFDEFPTADVLNIVYKNGKTKTINK